MKIKTSELTGQALDWAVAKCEGHIITFDKRGFPSWSWEMYSTRWEVAGPIIECEGIEVLCKVSEAQAKLFIAGTTAKWIACLNTRKCAHTYGPTPLVAAMRCLVTSKLGDEVDVPEELS